jgi:hypothetical protein
VTSATSGLGGRVSISDGITPMAAVDWAAAISALDAGDLPWELPGGRLELGLRVSGPTCFRSRSWMAA